jgi:hypothetical protein
MSRSLDESGSRGMLWSIWGGVFGFSHPNKLIQEPTLFLKEYRDANAKDQTQKLLPSGAETKSTGM